MSETTGEWLYLLRPVRPEMPSDPTDAEKDATTAHFGYLQGLLAEGSLILAGRTQTDDTFGLVIFRADNGRDAEDVMNGDPAVISGVMTAELSPYKVALSSLDS